MKSLLTVIANYIIGFLYQLPKDDIQVDVSAFDDILGWLNYFIPFYIIAPMFQAWLALLSVLIIAIAIWGYIKRNF